MAFYLLLSYLLPSVIQYAFTNAAGGSSWQGRKFQWINGGASTTSTIGGSAGSRETKVGFDFNFFLFRFHLRFSSYKRNSDCEVRSISFPTPSHPATYPNEKEINDIKTWVLSSWSSSCKPSTEAVCDALFKLSPLYERIQELINSLSSIQNENWVEELMDGLVGFLDVCGFTRGIVSELKGQIGDETFIIAALMAMRHPK
ncbi:hypothetical protein L2E82_01751 [Cichorium intybus]|uniref:Uncharacterized protein n=1 Tax=Cichorium intybus TaxID=13427 RepID=A0ACB9H0J2_CICIN|nr:hypothetical protein L2E82_01751 [Cichorium intybus]